MESTSPVEPSEDLLADSGDPDAADIMLAVINGTLTNNGTTAGNATAAAEKKTDGSAYFFQVEQLTFLWVLLTLIVIGNAAVLIALLMSKGRKSRMNFFIKNLAVADLSVGLISVLTDIIWKITISWEGGIILCKLIRYMQVKF